MQIVVTAGATPFGQALLRALVAHAGFPGPDGARRPVAHILSVDHVQPGRLFVDERIDYVRGEYEQPRFLARVMGACTDGVFHLAGLGAATGPRGDGVGLEVAFLHSVDLTRALLDACSYQPAPPVVVSVASGFARAGAGGLPEESDDACAALCELILLEGARRKVVDLRCVRLPCVAGGGIGARALRQESGAAPGAAAFAGPSVTVDEAVAALLEAFGAPASPDPACPPVLELAGRVGSPGP